MTADEMRAIILALAGVDDERLCDGLREGCPFCDAQPMWHGLGADMGYQFTTFEHADDCIVTRARAGDWRGPVGEER